ncbi:hypothetical protein QBC37DRAFT_449786 [Rhypophila decipiens]|uniref:Uncharacterized protein n=1 Tax=Rhypophila decipiens TaxID=261697 RepID=A0AAN6XZB1_9PEZI|nr:hypothetical protein QBC37DRAFT_449786 [Rhypophila decipiens]
MPMLKSPSPRPANPQTRSSPYEDDGEAVRNADSVAAKDKLEAVRLYCQMSLQADEEGSPLSGLLEWGTTIKVTRLAKVTVHLSDLYIRQRWRNFVENSILIVVGETASSIKTMMMKIVARKMATVPGGQDCTMCHTKNGTVSHTRPQNGWRDQCSMAGDQRIKRNSERQLFLTLSTGTVPASRVNEKLDSKNETAIQKCIQSSRVPATGPFRVLLVRHSPLVDDSESLAHFIPERETLGTFWEISLTGLFLAAITFGEGSRCRGAAQVNGLGCYQEVNKQRDKSSA